MSSASDQTLLLFRIDRIPCAIEAASVQSIVMPPAQLTQPPGSDRGRPGIFRHSEHIYTVVDLHQRFGIDTPRRGSGRLLLHENGIRRHALWVDEVVGMVRLEQGRPAPLPAYLPHTLFHHGLLYRDEIVLCSTVPALLAMHDAGPIRRHLESLRHTEPSSRPAPPPSEVPQHPSPTPRNLSPDAAPPSYSKTAPAAKLQRTATQRHGTAPVAQTRITGSANKGHHAHSEGVTTATSTPPNNAGERRRATPSRATPLPHKTGQSALNTRTASHRTPPPLRVTTDATPQRTTEALRRQVSTASPLPATVSPQATQPRSPSSPILEMESDNNWLLWTLLLLLLLAAAATSFFLLSRNNGEPRSTLGGAWQQPASRVKSSHPYGSTGEVKLAITEAPQVRASPVAGSTPRSIPPSPEAITILPSTGNEGASKETRPVSTSNTPARHTTRAAEQGTTSQNAHNEEGRMQPRPDSAAGQPNHPHPSAEDGLVLSIARDAEGTIALIVQAQETALPPQPVPATAHTPSQGVPVIPDDSGEGPAGDRAETVSAARGTEEEELQPDADWPRPRGLPAPCDCTHIVVEGDTLWSIAKRYTHNALNYLELARRSGIRNPHRIYPGNRVRIVIR